MTGLVLLSKALPRAPLETRIARLRGKLWRLYGRKIANAFLRAVTETSDRISARAILDALERGDLIQAVHAIPWEETGRKVLYQELPPLLRGALESAGDDVARSLSHEVGAGVRFDITSVIATDWVRGENMRLGRYLTSQQVQGITSLVHRALVEGQDPARLARLIREGDLIGLTPRDTNALFNYFERLLRDGVSRSQADRLALDYTERLLAARAEVVARTELSMAIRQGKLMLWTQAQQEGQLARTARIEWVADGNPCPVCEDLDGEQARIGDLFPGGFQGPPDPHPNCECDLALVA